MKGEHLASLSAVGAIIGAGLSSACCWLPLALLAAGTSAAGVTTVFDTYRGPLLGIAVLSLGLGFYLTYRAPKPRSASDCDSCAAPAPHLQRLNRRLLWASTIAVLVLAAFPEYIGFLIG